MINAVALKAAIAKQRQMCAFNEVARLSLLLSWWECSQLQLNDRDRAQFDAATEKHAIAELITRVEQEYPDIVERESCR